MNQPYSCMSDLFDAALWERYKQYYANGPISFAKEEIGWSALHPIMKYLYRNDAENGERPDIPTITMVKFL